MVRAPGGWMVRSSRSPTLRMPTAAVMNGFHLRYPSSWVRTCHTTSAGASMVTLVVMILLMSAPPVAADEDVLAEHVAPRDDREHDAGPQDLDDLLPRRSGEVAI